MSVRHVLDGRRLRDADLSAAQRVSQPRPLRRTQRVSVPRIPRGFRKKKQKYPSRDRTSQMTPRQETLVLPRVEFIFFVVLVCCVWFLSFPLQLHCTRDKFGVLADVGASRTTQEEIASTVIWQPTRRCRPACFVLPATTGNVKKTMMVKSQHFVSLEEHKQLVSSSLFYERSVEDQKILVEEHRQVVTISLTLLIADVSVSTYVGCYKDDLVTRDLAITAWKQNEDNTVKDCVVRCYGYGYKYAGLQVSHFCGLLSGCSSVKTGPGILLSFAVMKLTGSSPCRSQFRLLAAREKEQSGLCVNASHSSFMCEVPLGRSTMW